MWSSAFAVGGGGRAAEIALVGAAAPAFSGEEKGGGDEPARERIGGEVERSREG